VVLDWDPAYATAYAIEVSQDGKDWTEVYSTTTGRGGTETIRFAPVDARWVRYDGKKRATQWGHSLFEFRVFRAAGHPGGRATGEEAENTKTERNVTEVLGGGEQ